MKTLREFCDERQRWILDEIYGKMQFFSKTNMNNATTGLEALLKELTDPGLVSPEYLQEKLDLIAAALRGSS